MSGTKFDKDKPDLSLIPYGVKTELARAMMYGQGKYGRYNYRQGLEASRLVAAAERHLSQWFDGKDIDDESGLNHIAHAMANCLMILDTQALGTLKDDRYNEEVNSSADISEGTRAISSRG